MNQFSALTRQVEIKIRYRAHSVPAFVEQSNEPILSVRFSQPVRAITPGQIAVAYEGDKVQWAGIILNARTTKEWKSEGVKSTMSYDVIVVGAGHAGCEAAHIAAKLGAKLS